MALRTMNSSGQQGSTPYTVAPSAGQAADFTVANSLALLVANGGGTMNISAGSYSESLNWAGTSMGLNIVGEPTASTEFATNYLVTLVGNQVINTTGNILFQNINFEVATGDTITISGTGSPFVEFLNCSITNSGTGNCITFSASGSNATLIHQFVSVTSNSGIAVLVSSMGSFISTQSAYGNTTGTNPVISVTGASVPSFTLGTVVVAGASACVSLSNAAAGFLSFDGFYGSDTTSGVAFNFAAGSSSTTEVASYYDTLSIISSGTNYFATTTSAGIGELSLNYAAIEPGGTILVDPNITKLFSSIPLPAQYPLVNGGLLIGNATNGWPTLGTLTAGTGVTITNGAGSITIATTGTGFTWNSVSASQAMAVNNGYIVASGALNLALPPVSSVGAEVAVMLDEGTSWTITQGAGQQIQLGSESTTLGAGGSLASNAIGDTVTLVCTVANSRWVAQSTMGNITIV
jgi:hypothetical protein